MSGEWVIWAAGILDGEGAVQLGRSRQSKRSPNQHDQIYPYVRVSMVSAEVPYKLQAMFGGSVAIRRFRDTVIRGKRTILKPQWTWTINGVKAIRALRAMRPWLVVKAPHADLLMDFWAKCSKPAGWNVTSEVRRSSHYVGLTEDEQATRVNFYERLKKMQTRYREPAMLQ